MNGIASLAETGTLIGEPTRTAMLVALMDGRALTAGELASVSGVTPATASGHLARLVDGGLLLVISQGRYRYYRLASSAVAGMIETMMGVASLVEAARRTRPVATGPTQQAMRIARRCYDHLAGTVAVRIADHLVASRYLEWDAESASITDTGIAFMERMGMPLDVQGLGVADSRRPRALCRPCLDWSERRPHLAGEIGRSLLRHLLDRHWLRETPGARALVVTRAGKAALAHHFGIL